MPEFQMQAKVMTDLDAFARGYVDCALWLMTDELGHDCNDFDGELSEQAYKSIARDCERFQAENVDALDEARDDRHMSDVQLGHDFFLTRNRHGVGYWDRGLGELGERLTDAAHRLGEVSLYVAEDGLAYMD